MTQPHEQLSPEERALAERLSRISDAAAPSAALDARIFSAAQAAVAQDRLADATATSNVTNLPRTTSTKTQLRRTSRWGWGLGLAASLTLAVGIAWQLRPHQPPSMVYATAPAPTTPGASTKSLQAPATPVVQPSSISATSTAISPNSRQPEPSRPAQPPARAKLPVLSAAPPINTSAKHTSQNFAHVQQLRAATKSLQQSRPIADNARPLSALHSRALTAATTANDAKDSTDAMRTAIDQDARLPADAWLRAIRRHRFEGQSALARASLQAFREAHPGQAIPEDLRALLP